MWMSAVDDLPALRSFTRGLRRDLDAVVAGLTLWHTVRRAEIGSQIPELML